MDFATILQAIGSVGFPIVAFFVSIWALKYSFDKGNEETEKWRVELSKLTDAVNSNTKTLTLLVEELKDKE